jgi:diguanylate cyclase (GGDEF)-like protein
MGPQDHAPTPDLSDIDVAAQWLGIAASALQGVPTGVIGCILERRDEWRGHVRAMAADLEHSTAILQTMTNLDENAHRDSLTGLLNRPGIDECLLVELSGGRADGDPLGVLVIDIDGMRQSNDELGHAAGDQILRIVASAIRAQLRATDHVGRIGGDEFLAVLPGADGLQAEHVADQIVRSAHTLHAERAPNRQVKITAGWASTSEGFANLASLVAAADERLYASRSLSAGVPFRSRVNEPWSPSLVRSHMHASAH